MNAICAICRDSILSCRKTVVSNKCGHLYHFVCIQEWCKSSQTCPQCRQICIMVTKVYFNVSLNDSINDYEELGKQVDELKTKILELEKSNAILEKRNRFLENFRNRTKKKMYKVAEESNNTSIANKSGICLRSGRVLKRIINQ